MPDSGFQLDLREAAGQYVLGFKGQGVPVISLPKCDVIICRKTFQIQH